eukprot:gene5155-7006_t
MTWEDGTQPSLPSATVTLTATVLRSDSEGLGFSITSENPVIVGSVKEGGPGEQAGLATGDNIVSINGEDVTTWCHQDVAKHLSQSTNFAFAPTFEALTTDLVDSGKSFEAAVAIEIQRVLINASSHNDGNDHQQEAEDGEENAHLTRPATHQPTQAEMEAYKPFSSLDLLLCSPPHMATFLNFVLSPQGVTEDETLYLLNVNWFLEAPSFADARSLYNDFLATKAPMRISCIPDEVMHTVEQVLSCKKPTSAMLRESFHATKNETWKHVAIVLRDFERYLYNGFGDLCQTSRLIRLAKSEELRLIEDMINLHICESQVRQGDMEEKHVAGRFSIIEHTLIEFYKRSGGAQTRFSVSKNRHQSKKDNQKVDFYHFGHRFTTTSYTHPTFCAVCKTMILGIVRQGWDCLDCGMHIHKKNDKFSSSFRRCHTLVKEKCTGMKKSRGIFGGSRRKKNSKMSKTSFATLEDSAIRPLEGQPRSVSQSSLSVETYSSDGINPRSAQSSSRSIKSRFSFRDALPYDIQHEPAFWQETVTDEQILGNISKREMKRQELIYELIQTEKRFVRHLTIFKEVFRKPIIAENVLSSSVVHGLFANVDELLENNAPIAEALETTRAEHHGGLLHGIAEAVLPYFKSFNCDAYARFCSGQQRALKLYNQQIKANQAFSECIQRIETLSDVERLTFRDFLAKPMQRLTKYPLLIEGILKGTAEDNIQEREHLTCLLQLAKDALYHVQHTIRSDEDKKRLCEIDDKLDRSALDRIEKLMLMDLPSSGFELIHEGMQCQGKPVEVRCILMTHAFIFCLSKDERLVVKIPEKSTSTRGPVVGMKDIIVRGVAADPKSFFLISGNKSSPNMYELQAQTKQKASAWTSKLEETKRVFSENYPHYEESLMQQLNDQSKLADEDEEDEDEDEDEEDEDEDEDTVEGDRDQALLPFLQHRMDILQTLVKKIDTIHTEIADRLRVEGLEECLVSVSGDTHCPNSSSGIIAGQEIHSNAGPVCGLPSLYNDVGEDMSTARAAARYVQAAGRIASLSAEVAELKRRLVQFRTVDEEGMPLEAPPAVPESPTSPNEEFGSQNSMVLRPPMHDISHESFI